jgi:hypothetical protein
LVGRFEPGSGDSFARYAASRSVALLLAVALAICGRSPFPNGLGSRAPTSLITVRQEFSGTGKGETARQLIELVLIHCLGMPK